MTTSNNFQIPIPPADALSHSAGLCELIHTEIERRNGFMDFADFMRLALYQPGYGYYVNALKKFGEDGDFVTAPEIGNRFGDCIARQCEQVLETLGGGDILEVGAGSGVLAAQILGELDRRSSLPNRYLILEPSTELCQRQRRLLEKTHPDLITKVHWLDAVPGDGFTGVVVANEVMDALPVSRFKKTADGLKNLGVVSVGTEFSWSVSQRLKLVSTDIELPHSNMDDGYESELHIQAVAWIRSLSEWLTHGVAFLIDYGYPEHEYYHHERSRGTLRCQYRHHAHDNPFTLIGLQDISAHVNFTALARAAHQSEMDILGYTQQAAFLMSLGLLDSASSIDVDFKQCINHSTEVKKLVLPNEMGDLFKVLAVGRGFDTPLQGFLLQDHRRRL